ncbi:unnamed protein product [Caenorhabditis auriculariae]|uniref:DM13 domain-containing protein n=1 Tax=Caenorhabditis auriculariae TaxID=2777116 RepID=A0A8S1H292_9PELO|nr:unnamed protein product [Caenorhabditis auriculariae]
MWSWLTIAVVLTSFRGSELSNFSTEGSGDFPSPPVSLAEQLKFSPSVDDSLLTRNISKRAADFYNGIIDREFYTPFVLSRPSIPKTAVLAFDRPLQRGNAVPQVQYIGLWAPRGQPPHWGAIGLNSVGKLDGIFVKDGRIFNLSRPELINTPIRLLQYVGTADRNNFRFSWVRAIDADVATVVSEKKYGDLCSPRMAPAIIQDQGFEFLGEADIDNRVMYYVHDGLATKVEKDIYTTKVFLLSKTRCQCSCPLEIY